MFPIPKFCTVLGMDLSYKNIQITLILLWFEFSTPRTATMPICDFSDHVEFHQGM